MIESIYWQLQKILWVMYNGGQAKKVHHGSHYLWFLQQISNFPFFRTQKNTSNTIKVGQVMIHQLNFFSKYSPTIRECANVQPNPKLFWVLGLFGIYVSATHVRTLKKPLSPPKIFARYWVINWKMLSANAPIIYEFCVQNPSQSNICFWNFLPVTVNLVNALLVNS